MSTSCEASVVIVSFNTRDLLRKCIQTLEREAGGITYETIVVDNNSSDGSPDMVASEFPAVCLVRSKVNLGFAAANNRGFALVRGRYIVLLNSDAFVHDRALERAVSHMDANPHVGIGGGRLVGSDRSWQPSARRFPSPFNELFTMTGLAGKYRGSRLFGRADRTWTDPFEPGPADWVPGAFMILRREALQKSQYFDERFFLYFEEVDLCRQVKTAGYSVWYWPDIVITHLGGESAKTQTQLDIAEKSLTLWRMRSQLLYYRKHHGALGAWSTMATENGWNLLRALRNLGSREPRRAGKARAVRRLIATMNQAWRDTQGGQVCPPKPW